jgi:hypothetical protein
MRMNTVITPDVLAGDHCITFQYYAFFTHLTNTATGTVVIKDPACSYLFFSGLNSISPAIKYSYTTQQ